MTAIIHQGRGRVDRPGTRVRCPARSLHCGRATFGRCKLRGRDLMALRVGDVAPNGYAIDQATVRQRKTGRPVRSELTELTRQALDDYLRITGLKSGEYLFPGRRGPYRSLTTRQYARLVSRWAVSVSTAQHEADKGDLDLPPHWESPGRAAASGPPENREHGAIPRRRDR